MVSKHCSQRCSRILYVSCSCMVALYNERSPAFDGEFVYTTDNPPHRVRPQWALRCYAISFFDLLFALENGWTRKFPVNDFCRTMPGRKFAAVYSIAVPGCVCWFWPHNRSAVAARDKEETLSCGRRPVICCDKFLPFHGVSKPTELTDEFAKGLSRL